MGKQKNKNNPSIFEGLDSTKKDPNNNFFTDISTFKRGTFSSLENTNQGVNLEDYKDYVGNGVFSINSASDNTRARNQSNWEQTFNAVKKFLPNVGLEILNQTGALLDIEDYKNTDDEVGNWLSNWALEQKEKVNDANPIYRENPGEALNVSDYAWWVENGSSLVESITAFAATGYGVAGAISKGSKALQWLNLLGKTTTNTGKLAKQGIHSLSTAYLLNHAEGVGIATNVYKEVYQEELKKLQAENKENAEELAKEKAAKKAVSALDVNKINTILNLTSASLFVKTPTLTRQLRNAPSLKKSIKRANLEGLQEGVEESVNMIAENQALDDDYTFNKGLQDVFSEKGLESALLGYIGGAGQTGITNAGRKLKLQRSKDGIRDSRYNLQNQAFNEQNESKGRILELSKGKRIADNTDALMRAKEVFTLQKEIIEADKKQDYNKSNELKSKLLSNQAYDAFANGTTEQLLSFFEDIKTLDVTSAKEKGLEETTYKEQAEDAINYITSLEEEYNKSIEYLNTSDVYNNRARNTRLRIANSKLQNNKNKLQQEAVQDLKELGLKEESIIIDDKDNIVINNKKYDKENQQPFETFSTKEAEQLESVLLYKSLIKNIKDITNTQKQLGKEYIELISKKTQNNIKNKIVEEKLNKKDKEIKKETTDKVKKQTKQKETVVNEVKQETISTPDSSITGKKEIEKIKPSFEFSTTNPQLQQVVDRGNSVLNNNQTTQEKINQFKKVVKGLSKNIALPGVKGLVAQYNKGIRVLENDNTVIASNKQTSDSNKQYIKNKLTFFADNLVEKEEDKSPITEEDKNKIFNKVELLIDALNTMEEAGYDITDFKVVSDALLETVGEEKFIKIFENFKAVYNLTEKSPYPITSSYESLYFSNEEKEALIDTKKMVEVNTFLQDFYNLTATEFELKKKEVLQEYVESQGYTVYNKDTLNEFKGFKTVEGFNKIAYLAKQYKNNIDVSAVKFNILDFFISKEDVDKELNKNVDEVLLDPTILKKGEKLTFKVLDEIIYEDGTIISKDGTIIKNGETTKRNPVDIAPIAIYYNNKQIKGAYLHTTDWVNVNNISDKNDVDRQKNLLKKIRQTILSSEKEITTTIVERKDGHLLRDIKGNKDLVSINLPKVQIAVGKDDNLFQQDSTVNNANKSIINGLAYAVVPVNVGKSIGIPVQPLTLKEKPEYIDSILNAIKIYLNNTNDTRTNKILNETNLNITNINDLEVYINNFIYLAPYKNSNTSAYTFSDFKNLLNQTKDTLSIVRIVDGEIQFGRGLDVNGSIGYLNKTELNILTPQQREDTITNELNKLQNVLENNIYINVNKELLNTNFNLITITDTDAFVVKEPYNDFIKKHLKTDLYSATLPNGKEIYTVQSNLEFNTDFALSVKKIKEKENIKDKTIKSKIIKKNDVQYNFGDIQENFDDLAPKTLTEQQEKDLKENTPESLLIQGLTLNTQNTIINHLSSKFLQYSIKEKNINKAFDFITEDFPDLLTSAFRYYSDNYKENNSLQDLKNANVIKALKENYTKLTNLTINKLKQTNNLTVNLSDKVVNLLNDDTIKFENAENEIELDTKELNNWENDASFKENLKEKMSVNLKNFFSYIENAQINDKNQIVPKTSLLGIIETVPSDVVINDLNAILAYNNNLNNDVVLSATFDNMVKVLENWVDKKPYLINVLEELDNADEKIKNEFVQVMSKHYTNHLYVSKNEGNYYVNNSDNNTIVKVIQQNWLNNIYNNGLVTLVNDVFILNNIKLNEINSNSKILLEKLTANSEDKYIFAKKVLKDLGFNFDNNITKLLIDRGIKIKGNYKSLLSLFKDSDGAINNYIKTLNSLKKKDLQENHPFKDNTGLNNFARELGKENPIYFANSFKDVRGKSYFGYSNNKFLIDRVKKLKNDTDLLSKLKRQPFTNNSNWVNQLINNKKFRDTFNYFTFDGISSKVKEEGIKLEYASPAEVEEAKLALFYTKTKYKNNKSQNSPYIINVFYPTTSNKTVQYGLQVLGEEWGKNLINGKLHKSQQNRLFDIMVQPEINRILNLQTDSNKYNIKAYNKGGLMFHFLPALNSIKELWNKDGTLKSNISSDISLKNKVLLEIKKYVYDLVEAKLTNWKEYGFIKTFEEIQDYDVNKGAVTVTPTKLTFSNRYENDEHGARKEAYNFVLNYLVSNINISQTFTTDPAFYWKSNRWRSVLKREEIQEKLIEEGYGETTEEVVSFFNGLDSQTGNARKRLLPYYTKQDWIQEHEDTFNNIGKRLAGDAAPGVDIPESPNDTFKLGYIKDNNRPAYLYSYYKALLGTNAKDYLKVSSTDAQEFTTLKEHLHILNKQGKLTIKDMNTILMAEKNNENLSDLQLNMVFQPLKPVYVQNIWKSGIEQRIYVKSSSFPLFTQLTKGLEIDKLRKQMVKQKVDRIAFETAVKIGGTNTSTTIFDNSIETGKVSNNFEIDIIGDLTREGFKIQQDVPYNENKDYINDGTQQIKLLTANLREENFGTPDSSITGQDIQNKLDKAYIELFEINYNNLTSEVEYDSINGTINTKKLAKILQEEAIERNYPLYEIEALNIELNKDGIENFIVPLWLTGVAGKLEAMLNSIVNNRVRKLKPKGKSYVLGSSEGFSPIKEGINAQEIINNTTGIIWDKDWYNKTDGQLAPMRILDKEGNLYGNKGFDADTSYVAYAEILIPFKFKDNNGKLLDIKKYTKDGFIDLEKLPKDLLKVFGFRIPTQYLNSMSAIKIVGFLPKESGDLLLAPADWTIQMGSDFDVDKLYSNNYNTQYNEESGGLSIYREGENRKAILENEILDLHFTILGSPNPEVQKRILKPLDFGMLKDLADEIYPYVDDRLKGTGISDSYQSWKYLNARAGKAGIGVFSTDNTFIAQVQNKNIFLQEKVGKSYFEFNLKLGGHTSNRISDFKTNTGNRDKTDVISAFQSLAVDDENEQGLFKLNINNTTFDAIRTLVMSGFEEDIITYFLNQPIIRKYTELKIKADDSITNFSFDDINTELNKLYPITDNELTLQNKLFYMKYGNISKNEMIDIIKNKTKVNSNTQRVFFEYFKKLSDFGQNIQYVQSAINTHSSGFGKDLFYSNIKEEQVLKLNNYTRVANASNLIGDYFTLETVNKETLANIKSTEGSTLDLLKKWNNVTTNEDKLNVIKTLQELGYKSVSPIKDNELISTNIQFIKPTTLAGIVSTNALVLNNSLWRNFFPYDNVGVVKNLDAILSIMGKGERLGTQSTNKRKAFNDLKSFITTEISNTYTDGELIEERNRLLIDTKTNKSLASIIHILKSQGKLNNAFINRLDLNLKKEVLPSLITYQAATAENIDERHLHSTFSAMLLNNTINLGEFNGINYTPQKIAQDLITQQLISGGVQKATQFIKYIPINYLKSIGYYKGLENLNFENSDIINPIALRNQFAQHNPKRVKLKKQELSDLALNYKYYNNNTIIRKVKNISSVLPLIFSIKNETALSGFNIYVYNSDGNQWEQKDTLGSNNLIEYNSKELFGSTIIKSNKTPIVTKFTLPTKPKEIKEILNTIKNTKDSSDIIYKPTDNLEDFYNLNSENTIENKLGYILDKILNNENSNGFNKLMAKEIINNLNNISDYKLIINNNLDAKGSHNLNDKTIKLNPSVHKSKEAFEDTVLEEIIHALTKKAIINNNTGEVARLKSLLNVAKNEVVNYLNKTYDNKGLIMLTAVQTKLDNKKPLTQLEADLIYPILSETEFVGRLFKSKKLQELLNTTDSSIKGKSILDNVWNFIRETLASVGIIINKDSALEYALKDIISLINQGSPTNNQIQELNKVEKTYRTPDYIIRRFKLLNDDGSAKEFTIENANEIVNWVNTNVSNLEATRIDNFVNIINKQRYENNEQLILFKQNTINVNKDLNWGQIKDLPVFSNKGINTMRKYNTIEHFGNPFTGNDIKGVIPMKSIKDAVDSYLDWLGGQDLFIDKNGITQDLKNQFRRRDWILKQISDGKLDNTTLLYMNKKPNYYSHADALADIVKNKNNEDLSPSVQVNTTVGKANPLLLAYNNRLKRIQKNINKAQAQKQFERVEILKEELENVTQKRNETLIISSLRDRSSDNSDLYYKGIQDLEEVKTMLNGNRVITLEDTLYIRKILHFWQKGTSVLFNDEDKKSETLLADFKDLETKAETLESKLIIEEEKFINNFIKKYGKNITVQEIFEHFKDINGLTSKALDISRSGNDLLDSVFLSVKNANIDALDEGNVLLKDLNKLEDDIKPILNKMGHKELYEVFRQRNKNNKLTGHLVKRFTNEFSRGYHSKINNLYKNNNSINFENLLNWSKDNISNINLTYLFSTNLTKDEQIKAEKYKTDLRNQLGNNHYTDFIAKQSKQINEYKSRLNAKLKSMVTKYDTDVKTISENPTYKKEINNWNNLNSPYKFYEFLQKGLPKNLNTFKNFNNTNFVTVIPKHTKAYDKNYKQIENNPKLLEFYNFYNKVDNELKVYLPEDVQRTLSYTGIPFIKKTILNLYKDKGMKLGLAPIWDNIRESVRSIEENVISSKSIDPVTNKEEKDLKINLSNNNSEEIKKHILFKSIEYKNTTGESPTDELLSQWQEDKIDELAQLKSYDLAKILKVYTMTTLAYKHKSKIEDSIELAQNILNNQEEYIRTNTGEFKLDEFGNKLKPKNPEQSFTNLKKQFEYFTDNFRGKNKKDESVTKVKILTTSEKIEKKKIEELIEATKKSFSDKKITIADYKNNIILLQSYIDNLGGYAVNSKRGDNVLKWVQLVKMGWNLMSSIANTGFGYIANRLEGSGGLLYTNKQLTDAYKLTTHSIWKNWTFNQGETKTAKKIRTLMNKWDILKDASHEMFQRPLDVNLGKKFDFLSPYNLTQRTEYVNQAPIMIAMMMNTSLKSVGINKEGNLWEAYDENGEWKKEFGKEVTLQTNEKIKLLRNKIDQVNKMNHGNYDPTSSISLKKEFWGRAISQFRTWMFEGYATRFEGEKEDVLLGTRKGRYLSVRDFYKEVGFNKASIATLKGLTRSLTLGIAFKGADFNSFNNTNIKNVDVANLRKAMTEIAMYTTLYTSYLMLKAVSAGLDEDDDRKYAINLLINQGMRLKTDIIFYLNPGEFKNLLRDLVPATSVITDTTQFLGAVAKFAQGEDEITTGISSGDSRLLRESVQLLPIGTQVYKTINYGLQTFDK